jgi:hypothetical protein
MDRVGTDVGSMEGIPEGAAETLGGIVGAIDVVGDLEALPEGALVEPPTSERGMVSWLFAVSMEDFVTGALRVMRDRMSKYKVPYP